MSVQDRVEALFEVVMYLPTFIVEGSTRIGRGARERPGRPGAVERWRDVGPGSTSGPPPSPLR